MKLIDCNIFRFAQKYFPGVNLDTWIGLRLKARSNMPFTKKEHAFWERATNGIQYNHKTWVPPQNECDVTSRQCGKSLYQGIVVDYRALTFDEPVLPGRLAINAILAPTVAAGLNVFGYSAGAFESNEKLAEFLVPGRAGANPIIRNRQEAKMKFSNNSCIEVLPPTRLNARGLTVYTLSIDELAHFNQIEDSRFSDVEIFKSAMPAMSRYGLKGQVLLGSTPFERQGLLWQVFKKWFGKPNEQWLVFNLPVELAALEISTGKLTIKEEYLRQQEETDPQWYRREFGAEFLEDSMNSAFNSETIYQCTKKGRERLGRIKDFRYFGFIRPSSLTPASSAQFDDEWVAGVAHTEEDIVIIDAIKGLSSEVNGARITPDRALDESIQLFRSYGVREVEFDKFSGHLEPTLKSRSFSAAASKLTKSELFLALIEFLNSGKVELLDDSVSTAQLKGLQRFRSGTGRDQIKTAVSHDERAQVIAGLCWMARSRMNQNPITTHNPFRTGKYSWAEEGLHRHFDVLGNERKEVEDTDFGIPERAASFFKGMK